MTKRLQDAIEMLAGNRPKNATEDQILELRWAYHEYLDSLIEHEENNKDCACNACWSVKQPQVDA